MFATELTIMIGINSEDFCPKFPCKKVKAVGGHYEPLSFGFTPGTTRPLMCVQQVYISTTCAGGALAVKGLVHPISLDVSQSSLICPFHNFACRSSALVSASDSCLIFGCLQRPNEPLWNSLAAWRMAASSYEKTLNTWRDLLWWS